MPSLGVSSLGLFAILDVHATRCNPPVLEGTQFDRYTSGPQNIVDSGIGVTGIVQGQSNATINGRDLQIIRVDRYRYFIDNNTTQSTDSIVVLEDDVRSNSDFGTNDGMAGNAI